MILVRALPLGLVLFGLMCALVAAFTPLSSLKGRLRLLGSLFVGTAFTVGGLFQTMNEQRLGPGGFGVVFGIFLIWIGVRKHKRDPNGASPAAQML